MLEQSRIEGACRGRGRRWNSGARFTLPLRGHSPGPSGLGGVYFSKLLRANIFQSTAGQGSVRSIARSSWRGARRGVVDTVLGCSRTGFGTSRRESFESLKRVGKQWRRKAQTIREVHRHRARAVGIEQVLTRCISHAGARSSAGNAQRHNQNQPRVGGTGGYRAPLSPLGTCDARSSHAPAKQVIHRRVEIVSHAL